MGRASMMAVLSLAVPALLVLAKHPPTTAPIPERSATEDAPASSAAPAASGNAEPPSNQPEASATDVSKDDTSAIDAVSATSLAAVGVGEESPTELGQVSGDDVTDALTDLKVAVEAFAKGTQESTKSAKAWHDANRRIPEEVLGFSSNIARDVWHKLVEILPRIQASQTAALGKVLLEALKTQTNSDARKYGELLEALGKMASEGEAVKTD